MFNLFNRKSSIEKKYEFRTRDLTITLEPGWVESQFEETQFDNPLTFVKDQSGSGALQISLATAKKGEKFDIHKSLEKNNRSHIDKINKYNLREWTVFEYEDNRDGMFIKFFDFIKLNVHMFVTYTTTLGHLNKKELEEAIKIIKSIKVISRN